MKVSVIVPACDAQPTLARAIESLRAQTHADWWAVIVSDDLFDYARFLGDTMGEEPRLTFVSTGRVRSGCHNARNAGFPFADGDFVTQLDADDELTPTRFTTLLPLAECHGAAADNLAIVDDATAEPLSRPMPVFDGVAMLDLAAFLKLNAPLVPLVKRSLATPRAAGVELSEDVIANIQLIDRTAKLPVTGEASYVYRVRTGSIAHSGDSAARFEAAYTAYIERLENGDGFGVSLVNRRLARQGLEAKRALNRAFAVASAADPALTFQAFAAAFAKLPDARSAR